MIVPTNTWCIPCSKEGCKFPKYVCISICLSLSLSYTHTHTNTTFGKIMNVSKVPWTLIESNYQRHVKSLDTMSAEFSYFSCSYLPSRERLMTVGNNSKTKISKAGITLFIVSVTYPLVIKTFRLKKNWKASVKQV